MRYRTAFSLLSLVAMLVSAGPVFALNTLSLVAADSEVAVGEPVELTLEMSFDDPTVGGGVTLSFDDTVLSLASIDFSGALGDDPDFRCPTDPSAPNPVTCPSMPHFISFGGLGGLSGDRTVASIVFDTLAPTSGPTSIGLLPERAFGDFSGSSLDVTLSTTSVVVTPEPGALWLLSFGILAVAAGRRR